MVKIVHVADSFDGTHLDGAKLLFEICRKLKNKKNIKSTCVCHSKEQYNYFQKKKLSSFYYPSIIKKIKIGNLNKELEFIEKKYDCSVEQILVGDYDYNHSVPRKKAFADMVRIFKFWEDFIEKEKPDFILGGGQRFVHLIPYNVCKVKKTKFLTIFSSIIPNTFNITESVKGNLTKLDKYWEDNKDKNLTKKEKEEVKEYIKSIIKKERKPFVRDSKPKLNPKKIKYALDRIYASFFVERRSTPYLRPWRGIKKYILKIIRSKISKLYYSKPKKEKYIFFPLHVEWDSPIIVWNPRFIHQERLVELISKNLPAGYKLYVKSHPNDIGGNTLSQLKTIKNLPNVKLLNPSENSHDLIKNSRAVTVIAGTVGWEALLYGKPVIVFGSTYYKNIGSTYNVNNLSKINERIREALKNGKKDKQKLHRFVNAYMENVYPGQMTFSALYYSNKSNRNEVLNQKNIKKISNSLIKGLTSDF